MSESSFISIQNIAKHFGPVKAVDDINLDISKGEFFALLGPSGCGKTTLLRMLAGFETPTTGAIYIDNDETSLVPHYKRPVNMVFQNYAIFPHLNVFQNIAFGLRKDKLSKSDLTDRVNEALALIKMDGYGDRKADELSGGQRQRVALARALIKKPKVLLLDEPLGALDKKLREQMQLELRQLQRDVGITFVFVTHDQEEALTMADRVAVMANGHVLEVGAPEDLYERPQTKFVADFLGSMNFFEGEVISNEGANYKVSTKEFGEINAKNESLSFAIGENISVALRPENIQINPKADANTVGNVKGLMADSAYLGDRAHIYVTLEGTEQRISVAMQNLNGAASSATHGDRNVTIGWSESSVLLLKNI